MHQIRHCLQKGNAKWLFSRCGVCMCRQNNSFSVTLLLLFLTPPYTIGDRQMPTISATLVNWRGRHFSLPPKRTTWTGHLSTQYVTSASLCNLSATQSMELKQNIPRFKPFAKTLAIFSTKVHFQFQDFTVVKFSLDKVQNFMTM